MNLFFKLLHIPYAIIRVILWEMIKYIFPPIEDKRHKLNLKGPELVPIFGNHGELALLRKTSAEYLNDLCSAPEFRDETIIGYYSGKSLRHVFTCPYSAGQILCTNFPIFSERGKNTKPTKNEPFCKNLFNLGTSEWRQLRQLMMPAFNYSTIENLKSSFISNAMKLEAFQIESAELNVSKLTSTFVKELILSFAFGVEVVDFFNDENPINKLITDLFPRDTITAISRNIHKFNTNSFVDRVIRFFTSWGIEETNNLLKDFYERCKELRVKNGIERPDFLEALMKIERDYSEITEIQGMDEKNRKSLILSQAFVILTAGTEGANIAIANVLYELAYHPEIQAKLRNELKDRLDDEWDRKFENEDEDRKPRWFKTLKNIEYLDQVVNETLRKYPPVGVIDRESVEDFTSILEEKEIPKKSKIEIPILYFHHNPNFYPEPDKWDPERFSRSGIAEREVRSGYASKKLTLLTFGAGPRSCIGSNFALIQIKLMVYILLKDYEFFPCAKTMFPYKRDSRSITLHPAEDIYLRAQRIH